MTLPRWLAPLLLLLTALAGALAATALWLTWGELQELRARGLRIVPTLRLVAWQDEHRLRELRRLPIAAGDVLEVESRSGEIAIRGGDVDEVQAAITRVARGADEPAAAAAVRAMRIEASTAPGRVTLAWRGEDGAVSDAEAVAAHFAITVPRGTSVSAALDFGDLSLAGLEAGAEAELQSGTLRAEDLAGGLDVVQRFGEARIDGLIGALRFEGGQGELRVEGLDARGEEVAILSRFAELDLRALRADALRIELQQGEVALRDAEIEGALEIDRGFAGLEARDVEAARAELHGRGGELRAEDLRVTGTLDVDQRFGDVALRGLQAERLVLVGEGAASVRGRVDQAQMRTRHGSLDLETSAPVALDLESQTGDIRFAGPLAEDESHRVATDFGALRLFLSPDAPLTLSVETQHGAVENELPIRLSPEEEDGDGATGTIRTGRIGRDGPRLLLRSVGGAIRLAPLAVSD